MSRTTSFDWYSLSKLNQNALDIQDFSRLIKTAHFGNQLSKVPNSLRQKLLISFQIASANIKQQYQQHVAIIENLKFQKRVANQKMTSIKQQLQISMNKISTDKLVIEQKKKVIAKMKQKLKKKQQINSNKQQNTNSQKSIQVYFCPFCTRKDFNSRDDYTFHVFKAHANYLGQTNTIQSQQSIGTVNSEMKDLILSLKDKEIELVQKMMSKKKQIQQMQLEYAYNTGLRNIRSQPDFMQRKSQYLTNYDLRSNKNQYHDSESSQQLKGESQYLFYQPEGKQAEMQQKYKRKYIQKQYYQQVPYQNYKNKKLTNVVNIEPRQIVRKQQQKNAYYNIFSSQVAISQSDLSISPQKPSLQNNKMHAKQTSSWAPQQGRKKQKLSQQQIVHKNLSYQPSLPQKIQNVNHPQVQQIQSKLFNFTHNINTAKELQSFQNSNAKIEKKYQTLYTPSKSSISGVDIEDAHIFNSGPLMDDIGDGSDYEDYFSSSKNNKISQQQDQVLDESIKIIKPKINHTKMQKQNKPKPQNANINVNAHAKVIQNIAPSLKQNQNNLSVNSNSGNYTNNQSNILQYSKDKSLLQISNSKQKSSDLIDLSNSFSKRQLQSSKNNDETINLSDLKLSKLQKQKIKYNHQQQSDYSKQSVEQANIKMPQTVFVKKYEHQPYILQQFKREPEVEQKIQKRYENIQRTQKPGNQSSLIKMPTNVDLMKTNPGVLDQFFLK